MIDLNALTEYDLADLPPSTHASLRVWTDEIHAMRARCGPNDAALTAKRLGKALPLLGPERWRRWLGCEFALSDLELVGLERDPVAVGALLIPGEIEEEVLTAETTPQTTAGVVPAFGGWPSGAAPVDFDAELAALARADTVEDVKQVRDRADVIREILTKQHASLGWQNKAAAIKLQAERRGGEILATLDRSGGGRPKKNSGQAVPSFREAIARAGLEYKTAQRWQKEAEIPASLLASYLDHCATEDTEVTTAGFLRFAKDGPELYDTNEWYTPATVMDAVRRVLGEIDLDPASCEFAQRTVRAARYFDKDDDGLSQEWPGRVFLNPPYSNPEVELFTAYLREMFEEEITTAAILLVNNATDTKWFQAFLRRYPVCLTEGRISFERSDFEKSANRLGQAFFYLGPDPDRFFEVFGPIGAVLRPVEVEVE